MQPLAQTEDDIIFPTSIIAPIPHLQLHTDSFRCLHEGCSYICESLDNVKKHAKQKHQWINCQKQGGNPSAKQKEPENKIWIGGRASQRFFLKYSKRGPKTAFTAFEVIPPISNTGLVLGDKAEILATIDVLRRKSAQDKAEDAVNSKFARYSTDNWLRFPGWKIQHQGLEPTKLREMKKLPDKIRKAYVVQSGRRKEIVDFSARPDEQPNLEEEFIADCCGAVQSLIKSAQRVCNESDVGRPALQYITHRVIDEDGKIDKVMYTDLTEAAMTQYIMRYMEMTAFVLRTYKLPVGGRPPYVLSNAQKESIDNMLEFWQTTRPTATVTASDRSAFKSGMVEHCRIFWMALIDRSTKDRPHDSTMYCAVAILGVSQNYNDETKDFYLGAAAYSPVISSVVTVVKILIIYTAYLAHIADAECLRLSNPGLSEQEVIEQTIGIKDGVKRMTDSFMVWRGEGGDTSHNMHSIQALKAHARSISSKIKGKGHTHWVKCPDSLGQGGVLNINTKDIILSGLGPMLRSCCGRLRGQLERELLLTNRPPDLDLGVLVDNPSLVNKPDWSFLKDERNRGTLAIDGMAGENWLLTRLITERGLQSKFGFVVTEGRPSWNANGVETYLEAVKSFKEQLLVLVHLTAGAPARGTEILSVEHRNSSENPDGRNIFVENGLVAFAPTWSKTSGHTGKSDAIHRYTPREVSELVVYFLWLVLPFVEAIQVSHFGQRRLSTYLWEANYGHVAIDVTDYSTRRAGDNDNYDDDVEIEDISPPESSIWADRSPSAARRPQPLNRDGLYSSDRLRRLMHAEFDRHGFPRLGVQDWRHAYPAIQRQIARNSVAANTLEVLYFDGQPLANFQARASGHSERTEANVYGRDIHEGRRFTPDDRVRYRAVSVDWHIYLQFPSVLSPRNPDLDDRSLMTEHLRIKEREKARWLSMAHADMRQELRIFTSNQRAEFRPGQEEALRAIFKRTPRLVAIMATGMGKSSLFTLPAMHPQAGTTIVVVPTMALRLDLKRRTLPTGLTCAAYEGADDELPEGAKLVFVTPESATSERFKEYIESLRALGQLDRIVIDECHVVLESVENTNWRPQILELSELQGKGIQLVYLTGTLAPRDMPTFFDAIGLHESGATVLRQETTRPNIGYSVCGVLTEDGESPEHAQTRYIAAEMTKQPQEDQALVYCQSIAQGESIASQLNTAMYHGRLPPRKKARLLESFTKGEMQVMVATNAMGQGVDLKALKIVFHIGPPALLRDFVQESGRAGRDGRSASKSVILMLERRTQEGIRRAKPLRRTEASMVDFVLLKDGCRRQILDTIMDGTSRLTGCKVGEMDCDNCEKARTETRAATTTTTTTAGQTNEYDTLHVERGSDWTCLPMPVSIARTAVPAQMTASYHINTTLSPTTNIVAQKRVAYPSTSPTSIGPPTKKQKSLQKDNDDKDEDNDNNDGSSSSSGGDDSEEYGSSQLDTTEIERLNDNLAQQLVQDRRRKHTEQRNFAKVMQIWHEHCPICLVVDDKEEKHNWKQCPGNHDRIGQVEQYTRSFRNKELFNLERWAGCFYCFMPLELCQRQDQSTDKHGRPCFTTTARPCQFAETVKVAMAAIALFAGEKTYSWIRKQARCHSKATGYITLEEQAGKWLGGLRRWNQLRHCNNMCYTIWSYDQGNT
ncbi:helicase-related protein [Mycobacterium kansasii]|uniref:helicase-related protein n=2 Tax=Mycobacterium TaxID=1763 RepID=UPI001C814ADF|nr:helicase-related protein [Mycobacterium kansasii]